MNKKRETSFAYVCRQLAMECELKGEEKLAKEFRKAKHPDGLSRKAYCLYEKEIAQCELDIAGKTDESEMADDANLCCLGEADKEGVHYVIEDSFEEADE